MKSELVEVSKSKIESGTVMAATHSLKLSQPVMAKQRAQLQSELYLTLFKQRDRRLAPTAEARAPMG